MNARGPILILLLAGLPAAAAFPALASTRDDVIAGIERCGAIADDRTWLDCLYGADQPMRAKLGLAPAPDFQQRLVLPARLGETLPTAQAASQPPPHRRLGFFETLLGNNPPYAVSKMSSYRFDRTGAFIVTLENGQEWRQADVGAGTVMWRKPASTYLVTIVQGTLGSYSMHVANNPRIYRVERAH